MPAKWSRPVFSFRFYEGKISRALIVTQHLGGKHTARRHRAYVGFWHKADMPAVSLNVRFRGQSRHRSNRRKIAGSAGMKPPNHHWAGGWSKKEGPLLQGATAVLFQR